MVMGELWMDGWLVGKQIVVVELWMAGNWMVVVG